MVIVLIPSLQWIIILVATVILVSIMEWMRINYSSCKNNNNRILSNRINLYLIIRQLQLMLVLCLQMIHQCIIRTINLLLTTITVIIITIISTNQQQQQEEEIYLFRINKLVLPNNNHHLHPIWINSNDSSPQEIRNSSLSDKNINNSLIHICMLFFCIVSMILFLFI